MTHRHHYQKQKIRSLQKKRKFYQFRLFWIMLLCLVLVATATYLVLFLSSVQISHIEISGNQKVQSQDIEALTQKNINKKILGFSSKSIFLANPSIISESILAEFSSVESAMVQKKYFSGLVIAIKERETFAIFCKIGMDCFSIDTMGVLFEPINNPSKDRLVLSQSGNDAATPHLGQRAVDKHIMDGIVKIQDNLKQSFNIDIKEVMVSNPLIVTTTENWKIYFDPTADIDLQVTKMNSLLKDQISASARKTLQYIYLQYKDRAYFK